MVRCGAASGRLGYFLDWSEGDSHESTVKKFPPPLRSRYLHGEKDRLSKYSRSGMHGAGRKSKGEVWQLA